MNCKQVENLLPLYASHDLEERTERVISSHLRFCVGCAGVAEEYRDTRQLLHEFAPPVFDEVVYREMRRNVWSQIETESTRPSVFGLFATWFRPRWGWAAATALLIAVSAIGILFIRNRRTGPQHLSNNPPAATRNAEGDQPKQSKQSKSRLASTGETNGYRLPERRQPEQRMYRKAADRVNLIAKAVPGAFSVSPANPNSSSPSETVANTNPRNALRLEIQTKNPNIRIIWFAQPDTKPVLPGSKGI